jgi:hypothetical protein
MTETTTSKAFISPPELHTKSNLLRCLFLLPVGVISAPPLYGYFRAGSELNRNSESQMVNSIAKSASPQASRHFEFLDLSLAVTLTPGRPEHPAAKPFPPPRAGRISLTIRRQQN